MTLLTLTQPTDVTAGRAVSPAAVVAEEELRRMVLEALSELAEAATPPPPPIVRRRPAEIDYYSPVSVRGSRADSASGIPRLGAHRSERAWAL